jgi:glycine cleavage system aminomethyltransferase T
LPGNAFEAIASLGGSFSSSNIEDYYLTPYDLGYGPIVKFDHEFPGRQALETISKNPKRKKVTLAWNAGDAKNVIGSLFEPGESAKYVDFPSAVYSTLPYDKVTKDGKTIGISTWSGYSFNEKSMLSLAIVDTAYSEPGTEITLVWGEENGGSKKATVERHKQTEVRVKVGPVPYSEIARTAYRPH